MTKRQNAILLFFVVLVSLRLFDARFIDQTLMNRIEFGATLMMFFISVPFMFSRSGGLSLPVQLIVIGILFSIVMAYLSWSQSFTHSILETYRYITWVFFFYMIAQEFSRRDVEVVITIFTILYTVLFAYQFTHSSTIYFGKSLWGDEYTSNRGDMARIIFPGAGIFILGIFLAANKLTLKDTRHKWLWALIALAGLVVPVLQLTREFIAGVVLLYLYHFMSYFGWMQRLLVVVAFVILGFSLMNAFPNIFHGIMESLERDLGEGMNYIRVLAAKYYLFDFSPNAASAIFGNGAPHYGESNYGIFAENVELDSGYYISDVGIIGMYAMFGILAVIGWAIIWFKTFFVRLPRKYQYLKYYLWYLLLTSLTWYSVYHYHYVISTVICLYLFQRAIDDQEPEEA